MSREKLLAVAKKIEWDRVEHQFSISHNCVKFSRKDRRGLLFLLGYSILRMKNQDGVFYVIKDYAGKKPNKHYVGRGAYATVKDALLVNQQGEPVVNVDYDVVVRSSSEDSDSSPLTVIVEKNLDSAIFSLRAERRKRSGKMRYYTILKKAAGTLKDYLMFLERASIVLSDVDQLGLAIRVIKLVHDLHKQHNVAHRDLKPENILVMFDKDVTQPVVTEMWLSDFDFAQSPLRDPARRLTGSPYYIPHITDEKTLQNRITREHFDVFALGRLLWFPPRYWHCHVEYNQPAGHVECDRPHPSTLADIKAAPRYIFSDSFLESRPVLRGFLLEATRGFVNSDYHHSAAFILCALILEKENILSDFGADPMRIPDSLIKVVVSAFEKNAALLFSEQAKDCIRLIAKKQENAINKTVDYAPLCSKLSLLLDDSPQSTEAARVSNCRYALMPHIQAHQDQTSKELKKPCWAVAECVMS